LPELVKVGRVSADTLGMSGKFAVALRVTNVLLGGGLDMGKHHAPEARKPAKAAKVRTVRIGEAAFVGYETDSANRYSVVTKKCAHGSYRGCKAC
jgi:hypothetical protein